MKWLISDDKWVYVLLKAQIAQPELCEWFKANNKFGEFGCVPANAPFILQKKTKAKIRSKTIIRSENISHFIFGLLLQNFKEKMQFKFQWAQQTKWYFAWNMLCDDTAHIIIILAQVIALQIEFYLTLQKTVFDSLSLSDRALVCVGMQRLLASFVGC